MCVKHIREELINLYKRNPNAPMIEILGVSFLADEPSIFGTPNEDYIKREIEWYESQSLNVNDLKDAPAVWRDIADRDGYVNSNYGWCIYSEENGSQYYNVLIELACNPASRRATMIYNRPTMHSDCCKNGMNDFICTMGVHYYIRGDALHAVVQMRSNDAVYGYKNDYAWQQYVMDKLIKDLSDLGLEVEKGLMEWQVGSLHVYPRHYKLIEERINNA